MDTYVNTGRQTGIVWVCLAAVAVIAIALAAFWLSVSTAPGIGGTVVVIFSSVMMGVGLPTIGILLMDSAPSLVDCDGACHHRLDKLSRMV